MGLLDWRGAERAVRAARMYLYEIEGLTEWP